MRQTSTSLHLPWRKICRTWRIALVLAGSLLVATLAGAGGTPATPGGLTTNELLTPGGGDAAPGVGDYISSAVGSGLNQPYTLFIEVPPGQTELQIELFDADIFAAGAADRTGERDQNRTSFSRTRARYRLFDPSGGLVATRFSYGDDTNPAGGDDAWLLFFDDDTSRLSGGTTFADDFSVAGSYANDSGIGGVFAGAWIETNDLGGAGAGVGDVQVVGGELQMANSSDSSPFLNQPAVERQLDLATPGFVAAELSFDWRTLSGVDPLGSATLNIGDSFAVDMSADGGVTWQQIDTIADVTGVDAGSVLYDITAFIATNTRVRLRLENRYAGANESILIDDLTIRAKTVADGPDPVNGHWQLEIDTSGAVNGLEAGVTAGGDDVNAIGVRAHDGTAGAGGQEYNVYTDSFLIAGINNLDRSRSYSWYPWIHTGCELTTHDFDWDSDQPNPPAPNTNVQPFGEISLTSRDGTFTHTNASMSANDAWRDETVTGFASSDTALDYGLWTMSVRIDDWNDNNYGPIYLTQFDGAASPPTAQPEADTFRLYLPTDAGTAPSKPHIGQLATFVTSSSGSNPPTAGQTSRYAITVRVTNPSAAIGDITFSPTNTVTSNVPGAEVLYGGLAFVTSGSVVSQPVLGGSGNVVWNPGTLSPGDVEQITYFVDVTPVGAYASIALTGTTGSGSGTTATFVDETGDSTNGRATFEFGEICELSIVFPNPTQALVASVRALAATDRDGVTIEWTTAGEAGSVGFELVRVEDASGRERLIDVGEITAQLDAPQGGHYRLRDRDATASIGDTLRYALIETEASGMQRLHGPWPLTVEPRPRTAIAPWRRPRATPAHQRARRQAAALEIIPEMPVTGTPSFSQFGATPYGATARVEGRGLLRLPLADLAPALDVRLAILRSLASSSSLAIESDGLQLAWRFDERNDSVEVWIEPPGPDTAAFERGRVLQIAVGPGLRLATRDDRPPLGDWSAETYRTSLELERDLRQVVQLPLDPYGDTFFWDFVRADSADAVKSFAVEVPSAELATDDDAELTVRLHGGVVGTHRVEVRWDGVVLGEAAVDDLDAAEAMFRVDPALLAGAAHTIEVRALDAGDLVFVDGFRLDYTRTDRPADPAGQLVRPGGAQIVSAGPFTTPDLRVFDLSDPRRPVLLDDRRVVEVGGGWRAVWRTGPRVGQAGDGPFAVIADGAELIATSIAQDTPSDLRAGHHRADYLVIAPASLTEAAGALSALRAEAGLEPMVVALEDVFDEFRHGVHDPRAIRDFLAHARSAWALAPRWVVLAGAGSYDYRDLGGYGGTLVPPLLSLAGGSLIASDQAFVDLEGADAVPEMAIGRLPVLTAAELEAYVAKLRAAELGAPDAPPWAGDVLFGVDAQDGEDDFAADAARLRALLPAGYAALTADLGAQGTDAARATFVDALRAGVGWVGWVGHGGVDRLGRSQALLSSADLDGLDNSVTPVLAAITCLIGYHALPPFDALGEELVLADGGAVAVIAPVWLSDHAEAEPLADRLTRAVFQRAGDATAPTVGEALATALAQAAAAGTDPDLLRAYQVLGDPATRLRLTPRPLDGDCGSNCGGPG
ncbi:MAG: C25 family cysteine peptidase [Acidobacteriota bacterium]